MTELDQNFNKMELPRISIITPSYNQGSFLEETIISVLDQNYPNIEYIIIDGGSTDNSLDIIKKYEKNLHYWESKPDNGQSHAINKGFKMATGNILAWLNSDDYYLPNTLIEISKYFTNDKAKIVFGNCWHLNHSTKEKIGSDMISKHRDFDISLYDYIIQPSSFFSREAINVSGFLNEKLNYVFDWDWYIRAKIKAVEFKPIDQYCSVYRIHTSQKTNKHDKIRENEIQNVLRQYNSDAIVKLYAFCQKNKSIFTRISSLLKTLKLNRLDMLVFRMLFLKKLNKYKSIEIRTMLMVD